MSQPPPSEIPPEVPEEFAAAYRAAYEQAMADQSVPPRGKHGDRPPRTGGADAPPDDEIDLPERTRPIVVGTHREEEYDAPTLFERARDSWWFVPLLLLLLATLLIVAAYVGGRSFAHRIGRSTSAAASVSVRR